MKKRTRNILIKFFVTPEENALIEKNMALLGTENRSAFLRKMAIDGHVIKLNLSELKEARSLLRRTSDNFNQLARRVNQFSPVTEQEILVTLQQCQNTYRRLYELSEQLGA